MTSFDDQPVCEKTPFLSFKRKISTNNETMYGKARLDPLYRRKNRNRIQFKRHDNAGPKILMLLDSKVCLPLALWKTQRFEKFTTLKN